VPTSGENRKNSSSSVSVGSSSSVSGESSSSVGSQSSSGIANVVYGVPVLYGNETYQTVVIGDQTWFAKNLNYNPGTGNSACNSNNAYNRNMNYNNENANWNNNDTTGKPGNGFPALLLDLNLQRPFTTKFAIFRHKIRVGKDCNLDAFGLDGTPLMPEMLLNNTLP